MFARCAIPAYKKGRREDHNVICLYTSSSSHTFATYHSCLPENVLLHLYRN